VGVGLDWSLPAHSGIAFKLKLSPLVLTWAMLQVDWYLILYLAYLGLNPDPDI